MSGRVLQASMWAAELAHPDGNVSRRLQGIYGTERGVIDERLTLLRKVVGTFIERFGDLPVRLFRSPGRINLRGMHVDTHGGYLNLMTHDREVVVAAALNEDDAITCANVDRRFGDVNFRIAEAAGHAAFAGPWMDFITHPDVRVRIDTRRGHWGNYVEGAALSAAHRFPGLPLRGITAVIGSDVPQGAALSSSAALCTSLVLALTTSNGLNLAPDDLIVAARDAEWYTGSRCGLSDQAAMVLPKRGELVNLAIPVARFDSSGARRLPFPDALRVLVINSYTERSLSGAALVDYTKNRFAYSLALAIMQHEMRAEGLPDDVVEQCTSLARLCPAALADHGGEHLLWRVLRRIPESVSIDALRQRYDLPGLDEAYARYFGSAPESLRPTQIGLRGPLLFGIAESERARLFIDKLEQGDYAAAGRLMTIGHDGDRRVRADGQPFVCDTSGARDCFVGSPPRNDGVFEVARNMERHCEEGLRRDTDGVSGEANNVKRHCEEGFRRSNLPPHSTPPDALPSQAASIALIPGAYGASSPVLDALVDAALTGGALGASLTGAGIAGAVLALCRAEDADRVSETVRARLSSDDYAPLARRDAPLTEDQISQGVRPNTVTASACELMLYSQRRRE